MTRETKGEKAEREAEERRAPGVGISAPTDGNAFPGTENAEPVGADAPLEPAAEGDASEANAAAAEAQGGATGDVAPEPAE